MGTKLEMGKAFREQGMTQNPGLFMGTNVNLVKDHAHKDIQSKGYETCIF